MRLITFLEGLSLIVLVCVAVPLKYFWNDPHWVEVIGRIHGALFIAFLYAGYQTAEKYNWDFKSTTFKVIVASFIPFGTFVIDHRILKPLHDQQRSKKV